MIATSARTRGFTLIEALVAAAIGLIILLGATNLATLMVRTSREVADAQAMTTRAQLARGLIAPLLGSLGDAWLVDGVQGAASTGAPGQAHCVTTTRLCTTPTIFPIVMTDGGANNADALTAIVPRPGAIESVEIMSRAAGASLPNDCTSLPASLAFDVRGRTTAEWGVGTLVLIAKRDHVSVARVDAAFAAGASATTTRQLTLELGAAANLAGDDGGRSTACSAFQSLRNALVLPVSEVRLRLNGRKLEIAESRTATEANAPVFVSALEGIDDLQFRLVLARIPADSEAATAKATLCTCNAASALDGAVTLGTSGCSCTATEKLNRDSATAAVYRVVGLEVGVLVRGDVPRSTPPRAAAGMFNRTSTIATDAFGRHRTTFFIGLANAHSL